MIFTSLFRELAVLQREFEDHFVEDADLAAIQRQIEDAERAMSAARRRRARLCIPNPKTQPELLETTPF